MVTWPVLGSVLALTSRDCILTEEFPKRLYQVTSQSQMSHTLVRSWLSLTWPTSCPSNSSGFAHLVYTHSSCYHGVLQPNHAMPGPLPDPALMWFSRC